MADETGPGRSFQPVTEQDLKKPEVPPAPGQKKKPMVSRNVPSATVNPDVVREFEAEVIQKLTTGRKRMHWFANHALSPILKRSKKESQIKAAIPQNNDNGDS